MGLEYVLNYLLDQHHFLDPAVQFLLVLELVVAQEHHIDFSLENGVVLRRSGVLFDSSDEPPARVSAVVSRVVTKV